MSIEDVLSGKRRYWLECGDCRDGLPLLPAGCVDALVTDPPYGIALGSGKDKRQGGKHGLNKPSFASYEDSHENILAIVVPILEQSLSLAKRGAVFSGPHLQDMPKSVALGGIYCSAAVGRHCWGFKNFTPILLYGKHPALHKGASPTVLRSNETAEKNGHPCPKPLEWMRWLVDLVSLPDDLILDPFAGSGTTGVACLLTGRRFIGWEIDPAYHAIAVKRLEEVDAIPPLVAAAQASLFDAQEE